MAKTLDQKLIIKREALAERTAKALKCSQSEVKALLSLNRLQSLRLNPLMSGVDVLATLSDLGWSGEQYSWVDDCYSIDTGLEAVRDSQLATDGYVYIQNAASWLPVLALNPQPADQILDICAAPGGKTSHLAALTYNQARITANDNSRPRLAKLRGNLERLGVENVECTLFDATQLARKLDGRLFDKILLDAPCSGEGMMNYEHDKDFASWSVAHIKRLQQLQKRIILQAWQLLKPGGTLVYSTCTMAPEENEAVVDYLLRKNDGAEIMVLDISLPNRVAPVMEWNGRAWIQDVAHCLRLKPSESIEAFFVACIRKC